LTPSFAETIYDVAFATVLNATVAADPVAGEVILVIEGAEGMGFTKTKTD
jgi:hypothetical protein